MYGETFYGRHTAQHQLQWSQIQNQKMRSFKSNEKVKEWKVASWFPLPSFGCVGEYQMHPGQKNSRFLSWSVTLTSYFWGRQQFEIYQLIIVRNENIRSAIVTKKWASSWENLFFALGEQERCRSASASAQSDQHLCCLLPRPRSYFHTSCCANSEDSGETARMHRLAWAFGGRLCDNHILQLP